MKNEGEASMARAIEALRPRPEPYEEVLVHVHPEVLSGAGQWFKRECLEDHPNSEEFSAEDLDLMAAAFLTLLGRLPIWTYDLTKWIATCGAFDPEGIRVYAEEHLGMERLDTPVSEQARRRAKRG
jgi:hypothetical protein